MEIVQLKEASEEQLENINALLQQLRANASETIGSMEELKIIFGNPNAVLIVAKDGERIAGMATLYVLQKIGKRTGIVEDVVVDEAYRGHGLGEQVMKKVIESAREHEIQSLSLTSRPARVAAHKLYKKLGFAPKETTPFSLRL